MVRTCMPWAEMPASCWMAPGAGSSLAVGPAVPWPVGMPRTGRILKQGDEVKKRSVADPDCDPPDPHVFGPPGSGSISQSLGMDPDPSIIMQK